jgi:hypothetical protein
VLDAGFGLGGTQMLVFTPDTRRKLDWRIGVLSALLTLAGMAMGAQRARGSGMDQRLSTKTCWGHKRS